MARRRADLGLNMSPRSLGLRTVACHSVSLSFWRPKRGRSEQQEDGKTQNLKFPTSSLGLISIVLPSVFLTLWHPKGGRSEGQGDGQTLDCKCVQHSFGRIIIKFLLVFISCTEIKQHRKQLRITFTVCKASCADSLDHIILRNIKSLTS